MLTDKCSRSVPSAFRGKVLLMFAVTALLDQNADNKHTPFSLEQSQASWCFFLCRTGNACLSQAAQDGLELLLEVAVAERYQIFSFCDIACHYGGKASSGQDGTCQLLEGFDTRIRNSATETIVEGIFHKISVLSIFKKHHLPVSVIDSQRAHWLHYVEHIHPTLRSF